MVIEISFHIGLSDAAHELLKLFSCCSCMAIDEIEEKPEELSPLIPIDKENEK